MAQSKLAPLKLDAVITDLTQCSKHQTLAVWAADCAERVLPYFEAQYPHDARVRQAIEAGRNWVSGRLTMTAARKAAFAAHAAARDAKAISAVQAAARAAGHAAATAHVPTHAVYAAIYALTAVRSASQGDAFINVGHERQWQYQHLLELRRSDV